LALPIDLTSRGAPENFESGGKQRTFVKIHHARHEITLRPDGPAEIVSEVRFTNSEEGTPIIDFHLQAASNARVRLDGASADLGAEVVPAPIEGPDAYTYRVVKKVVDADAMHLAEIRYPADLAFAEDIPLFFEMSDFDEARGKFTGRCFLDRYLPANLEFDQHPVEIALNWAPGAELGAAAHTLFSNGRVVTSGANRVEVSFPSHFNSSSPFLVVAKKEAVHSLRFEHPRQLGDPRPVEVTTFTTPSQRGQVEEHAAQAFTALRDLERWLGPFPYDQLLLFSRRGRSMEYAGAATVSDGHVSHEILHSYFGRGTLAANGDGGWIDEAIAIWADAGRRRCEGAPVASANCGARGAHHRRTSPEVVAISEPLIGHLAYLIDQDPPEEPGSSSRFDEVLRQISRIASGRPLLATDFQRILESLTQHRYQPLFARCVYGEKPGGNRHEKERRPRKATH